MIARGAFLHDIGKMAIPDAILTQARASLTPEEITDHAEHCYHGYQMLKKIPFLAEAAEIVYSHQERFDGTGYPRGLKGEQIPLGARMFSVADTLDAITSDRPYRPAQSLQAAREEIERWSGRQFDPRGGQSFSRHAGKDLGRSAPPDWGAERPLRLLHQRQGLYPRFAVAPSNPKLLTAKNAKDAEKPAFKVAFIWLATCGAGSNSVAAHIQPIWQVAFATWRFRLWLGFAGSCV